MNSGRYHRKISAILSADVAGYSRLMGDDEEDTVRTLTRYREIMSALILDHRGRVIDAPGDNLLAEFTSVVDALRCAGAIQQELASRNAELAANRRMHVRIGINLGDVIEDQNRIYGDGVNVAARLEGLAEPGGITISGTAYDQVKNKLPYRFEFIGEQQVKNIRDPVRTYKVGMGSQAPTTRIPQKPKNRKRPDTGKFLLLGVGILLLAAAGLYFWANMHAGSLTGGLTHDIAKRQLSQGASIAVLPFKNLSGDQEQEYFSDGITNDIITDLSRFHNLLVIASNTVFTYKDKTVNIKQIGRELEVRYVLEGSVQKVDKTVRINAQLIDASSGTHIWTERYERTYEDIFELQGDIVQTIVSKLAIQTFKHEQSRAMAKKPQDLQAYDYLLQGWAHYQLRTQASNHRAAEMFAKALALDPRYAAARVGLGWVNYAKVSFGWTEFPHKALDNAFQNGRKALELDSNNASAHALLCSVYTFQNRYDLAIREAERAIELNPNDAYTYGQFGWALLWSGRVDEAIAALETSLRLDTSSTRNVWLHLGMAYYLKKRYEKALALLEKGVVKRPGFSGYHILLAATFAKLGRLEHARNAADNVLRLDPFFEVETFGTAFRDLSHREAIAQGLREAGLK